VTDWKTETTDLAILFHAEEGSAHLSLIPRDAGENLIEERVMLLWDKGFLRPEGGYFRLTDGGKEALAHAARMLDELSKLRIFGSVRLERALTADEQAPDNPALVFADMHDPRFGAYGEQGTGLYDLRLAVLTGLGEALSGYVHEGQTLAPLTIDPHRVVFLQLLGDGTFSGENLWANLLCGLLHAHVEEIVRSAYRWQDLDPSDPGRAAQALLSLYAAGLIEERKRSGLACSSCKAPLAIYEWEADSRGCVLDICPSCKAPFTPPLAAFTCGRCSTGVSEGAERCSGCGVLVDFAAPPGVVSRVTTKTTRTTWRTSYTYEPYGYFDPFCPAVDYGVWALFSVPLVVIL